MLPLRLNARVIAATPMAPILDEMRRTGATEAGIVRMMPKAGGLAMALEHVGRRQANLLKQEMLAAGGDVAVSHGVCGESVDETSVAIVGTRRQFDSLVARLAEEPFDLPDVGREIRRAVDAHARRRFDIPLGRRSLSVGPAPAIVGIVNVTPDSFSDGGQCLDPDAAADHGHRLVDEGADILDVGGESTRPGSEPVAEDEERRRVLPVVERLAATVDRPISIDTRRARVAREAVAAGASIINDVTGLQGDPDMARTVAEAGAGLVIMHMQGEPRSMQQNPHYENVMADICRFLRQAMAVARDAGVAEEAILVDPGIGFGKTVEHNLTILARLDELRTLGRPVLVGPSRKRFLGALTGVETPAERTFSTAAACVMAVAAGALVVRVHDVQEVRQALAVAYAVTQAAGSVTA